MPNGILAVSPCTIVDLASGMPSWSDTSWANVVSWPCPWLCVPVNTLTLPVGWTRTLATSYSPARAPSCPTSLDGAMPQAST